MTAKVFQHLGFQHVQVNRYGFWLRLRLCLSGNGWGNNGGRRFGRTYKGKRLKAGMTIRGDMSAPQVRYEWIVTRVSRDNVKMPLGIGCHGAANVKCDREIEGVVPG